MANAVAASATQGAASDAGGPAAYGTRSRNRNGGARPNYAEDREDAEFEPTASSRRGNGASSASAKAAEPEKANGASTRRSGASTVAVREHCPNTSNTNAADTGPGSRPKKRKSPGASALAANVTTAAGPSVSTRKSTQTAPQSPALGKTHAVTFENTSQCLVNGSLVADDKTMYGPNGA